MDNKNTKINNKLRQEVEEYIYKVLDTADPTKSNSNYYKDLFSNMDNNEFYHFFENRIPIRFHQTAFDVEPKMYDIIDAFKVLGSPLFEVVNLPYLAKDDKINKPIRSKECLVVYLHIKRMKQTIAKKNSIAISNIDRDLRTGLLLNKDKGGKESDMEFTTLAVTNMDHTIDEYARLRADSMKSKEELYTTISQKGYVAEGEIVPERSDVLAGKMLYVYMLGANIVTNLAGSEDGGYITPYTISTRNRKDVLEV